jgi:hypothetical protein
VVTLASQRFTTEDRLPPIAVAGPLVEHKHASKVTNIDNFLQQFVRQVVEHHAGTVVPHVQRPQLLTAPTRNRWTTQVDSEVIRSLNKPVRDFNHLDAWHGQLKSQTQVGGKHLVRKHSDVLGIILEFDDVGSGVRRP